jgi:hypothetical protein
MSNVATTEIETVACREPGGTHCEAALEEGMTIGEAVKLFKLERRTVPNAALREVVNYMIDHNIRTEFSNHSYLDALELTDVMFSRSLRTIRMLTGNQGDGFVSALKETFVETLERIKRNEGFVRIIVLGKSCPGLEELRDTYPETLEVILAQSTAPVKHFLVCDTCMARMEETHDELTPETPITAVKARVCFNDKAQGKALEESFDNIWNRLKLLIPKVKQEKI